MMKNLFLLFLVLSCTKVPVGPVTTGPSIDTPEIKVELKEQCSNFTPTPVDILMLVDNSGSVPFLKSNLTNAVRSIAKAAGQFFDYRIYVVPLIPPTGETALAKQRYQLVQNNPGGIPLSASIVSPDQIFVPSLINTSKELGFKRTVDIIRENSKLRNPLTDTVFRKKAYTMTILLSNGDDKDFGLIDSQGNVADNGSFERNLNEIKKLKTELELKQLRFISVVNHKQCGSTVDRPGARYKAMSRQVYTYQGINDSNVSTSTPDSYDLCNDNLEAIFDRLAKTVESFKNGHTYKFWPLGTSDDFDPSKLIVKKKISGEILSSGNTTNGFTFRPQAENSFDIIDRTVHPSTSSVPAERYNGFFIELHGQGRVTYPDCLIVRKEDFDKFFGFVVWGDEFAEPDLSTLKLFIDNKEIDQALWEYQGHQSSVNLLVKSATDLSAVTPGIFKTGFTIRLKQGAVHNDGAKIEVRYKAKPL